MAGRGKAYMKVNYAPESIYRDYKATFKKEGLSRKEHRAIIDRCNKDIISKVIMDSKEILLPCMVGRLRVAKKKTFKSFGADKKFIPKDWKATKAAGKWIYELNEHRSGYKYWFQWRRAGVSGIYNYKFTTTRTNKRRLAQVLKTMPQIDYFE